MGFYSTAAQSYLFLLKDFEFKLRLFDGFALHAVWIKHTWFFVHTGWPGKLHIIYLVPSELLCLAAQSDWQQHKG